MVLGINSKTRKGNYVHVDYIVHIHEIKPWPPSQSLMSLRSVLIQWENGERSSGSTSTVVPTIGAVVGEGKIEFTDSFRLPVTLIRDTSVKGKETYAFQKNLLEFNLCEPRREKIQLLATAIIDLAEFGIVKETVTLNAPMNSKRSFRNTTQPILFFKLQPVNKGGRSSSSSRNSLSREMSLDKNGGESVSALMNEEYAEEAAVVSCTDDDVSSQSSLADSISASESNKSLSHSIKNKQVTANDGGRDIDNEHDVASKLVHGNTNSAPQMVVHKNLEGSSSSLSSKDMSYDSGNLEEEAITDIKSNSEHKDLVENLTSTNLNGSQVNGDDNAEETVVSGNSVEEESIGDEVCDSSIEDIDKRSEERELERQKLVEDYGRDKPSQVSRENNDLSSSNGKSEGNGYISKSDRLKHVKSVRSLSDSPKNNELISAIHQLEINEVGVPGETQIEARSSTRKDNFSVKDNKSEALENKIHEMEGKIEMLERELREAAASEAALYSVVAEHGSSTSKVHAPARRLSRLYLHAYIENSQPNRATAARTAASGLVLVAKACGNDVPRLTFWLSNCVVLRAIISKATRDEDLPISAGSYMLKNGGKRENKMKYPLKWKDSSSGENDNERIINRSFSDWQDPNTFISALEKVEAWIFSRIVESVWWQTLTPRMQSSAVKTIDKGIGFGSSKNYARSSSFVDDEQANFSLELWKKAFKDACERLCPLRAGGHKCGCLPVLARLVMEQCVARLDVAMFNAILRESGDDIPTDPVSDPISDSKVLPVPAGKSSFGAGAQLKNAIGNWSRWLTDLFGIDDDDDDNEYEDDNENDHRQDASFKSFHLLNALSDLMMLPKDMLLNTCIRKEVCPTFETPLIKIILENFTPDEFCPDPIPDVVREALAIEDPDGSGTKCITNVPCTAAPPLYTPPCADSISGTIGEGANQSQLTRSGSSVLRKSYTSDDELDELKSPLALILNDRIWSSSVPTMSENISEEKEFQSLVRYELLRGIWMN